MTAEQGCAGGAVTTIGMGGCGDIGAVGGATGAETRAMPGGMGDPCVGNADVGAACLEVGGTCGGGGGGGAGGAYSKDLLGPSRGQLGTFYRLTFPDFSNFSDFLGRLHPRRT